MERLRHPVIVRGFGAHLEGRHPHLLLEHLEGPSLRDLLRRHGALTLEQVLPLALHVAAALHYLAAEQVVHLDIKPDNLIMGVPPRVIDLSVARSLGRARRTKGHIGTDPYMAPEQCAPDAFPGAIGPAADIWGLGATVWQCVAGRRPFPRTPGARDSDDPAERFPQLTDEPVPLPRSTPEPVVRLLAEMLDRDPSRRPAAAAVVERLEPVVDALPRRLVLAKRGSRLRR